MYHEINATELFRERHIALLQEAEDQRLARRLRSGEGPSKRSKLLAAPPLGFLLAALVVLAIMLVGLSNPAYASTTLTVNSTGDQNDLDFPNGNFDGTSDGVCDVDSGATDDQCTLRAAIQEANVTAGTDTIEFAIPGSGVHTIAPTSPLPLISEAVTIDGYTQSGAEPNTKEVGDDAVLTVELDGTNVPSGSGLEISNSSGSVIKGLVINRFGTGIAVGGASSVGNHLEGNFIGTDPSGTVDKGNSFDGVGIFNGASKTVVGGTTVGARNVLSANDDTGIFTVNSNSNLIEGNYVGTDRSGTKDLGNSDGGVVIQSTSGTTVGGTTAATRNVISGNGAGGLGLANSQGTKVLGNRIGTTASGSAALGNDFRGVAIIALSSDNLVGDGTSAGSNIIAFNTQDGVEVDGTSSGNQISRNSIFSNGGLGIDLLGTGETLTTNVPTPNDPLDVDSLANNLQNNPVITSAKTGRRATTIKGNLQSNPSETFVETFVLRFYSNPPGGDEGKKFIGEKVVATDASGNATFTFKPQAKVRGGTITATATRDITQDTSEFSAPKAVTRAR